MSNENQLETASIADLVRQAETISSEWQLRPDMLPRFRGHADSDWSLTPSVLRGEYPDRREQDLAHNFKKRARGMCDGPSSDALDEWLYLMQHSALPTRLLDWTESALVAFYFACIDNEAEYGAVWVLNPFKLNEVAIRKDHFVNFEDEELERRCRMAFEWRDQQERLDLQLPIAIEPTHVHRRLQAQKGCFTIHGWNNRGIEEQLEDTSIPQSELLRQLKVPRSAKTRILRELRLSGVTHSALFPDLDGLAAELREFHRAPSIPKRMERRR